MSGEGKLVCVTGASGFIASWLVKLLLQRGYSVKASVRDPADPRKTEHLRSLEGASERLHLFKANLLEEGSFDAAIDGCDGVFHTASPFYHDVIDPQSELIDPAVKGTLNVLNSCSKSSTVRRVVVTSSAAAVVYNERPRNPDVIVDETWFASEELNRQNKAWYVVSKILAEESAWKFAKDNAVDLVTVNPAMVIGPLLQPTLNTSNESILKLINGSSTFPNATFGWVDVRDVCKTHILAYEDPSASGRYYLAERVLHFSDLANLIKDLYPSIQVPDKPADDKPFVPRYQASKEKVKGLGINYTPLEVTIKETIESLKEKGTSIRSSAPTHRPARLHYRELKSQRMSGAGKLVCVTGASGFIASWLVKLLLQRGYTVKASVRDPDDPKKTEHLRSLEGASERLHLFKANLLEEGSFDAAIDCCDGVFHTVSPFYNEVTDQQFELKDPAVKGTLNVLNSCSKSSTVRRVVVTSTAAAIVYNERPRNPDVIVDETWFASAELNKQNKAWCVVSKILAEESAWKFAKDNAIDLVTVNPAMVIGPLLQPTLNPSNEVILKSINGSSTFPNATFGWVDVRDVCKTHILAYEDPSASGRYYLAERVLHISDLVKLIKDLYPSIQVPDKPADDKPFVPRYQASKEKVKGLGINYTPLEVSIKETIESLKEKGFVNL